MAYFGSIAGRWPDRAGDREVVSDAGPETARLLAMRPVPTYLKVLKGNPGKRAIRPEPKPEIPQTVPEAPPFLIGYSLDEWHRVAPELHRLRLLTTLDVAPLAAYCAAYGRWRTAEELLNEVRD